MLFDLSSLVGKYRDPKENNNYVVVRYISNKYVLKKNTFCNIIFEYNLI